MRKTIAVLNELSIDFEKRIKFFDREVKTVFVQSAECQHIANISATGPKKFASVVAANSDGQEFKNVHRLAACPGLVLRQLSGGDSQVFINITKRSNKHLRTPLIHAVRAVVCVATNNNDGFTIVS